MLKTIEKGALRHDREKTARTRIASIGFIGAGTVGTALAFQLGERGYPVRAVASRTRTSAEKLAATVGAVQSSSKRGIRVYNTAQQVADRADLVFVTTPDDAIAGVVAELSWHPGQSVVHCSGAASLDILEPARGQGARVGAIHPLQTFASTAHAIENLPGSTFGLEAHGGLLETLKEMVTALDGTWVKLGAGDKVLYHASAVIACNYLVTLMSLATSLWEQFGASTGEATAALMPLLRGTLNNLENVGLPNCLTGPIARGDLGTIGKHLDALQRLAPEVLSTYRELGLKTVPVALAKGKVDRERAEAMRQLLSYVQEA